MEMSAEGSSIHIALATTLVDPLHDFIRAAVMKAYQNEFNQGKPIDTFLVEGIVHEVAKALDEVVEQEDDEPRSKAYDAIDTERDYQDAGFGNAANTAGLPLTRGECLLVMDTLIQDAKNIWYQKNSGHHVQHLIRKVGAVAVQSLEHHGAPKREFTPGQQEILDQKAERAETIERAKSTLEAILERRKRG